METCDALVVGGGMAGVSIASELASDRRVVLVDMEAALAFHTTGRSAALFLASYGPPAIRSATVASRAFFEDGPFLSPMPSLTIARPGRAERVRSRFEAVRSLVPDVTLLDADDAVELQPALRRDQVELAMLEPGATAIDVDAVHQQFLRTLRRHGGDVVTSAALTSATLAPAGGASDAVWELTDSAGRTWRAPLVVNAAGAWADRVAALVGAAPVGLQALRRTAFLVDAPPGFAPPMIDDGDEAFYVKPDAGQLLCSPADETHQRPGDARPDELEIARAIEEINATTTLGIRSVRRAWGGLRTFAADRAPVVGLDPAVPGFFWCAGQGGFGIQTAPALARAGAALARSQPLPADLLALGLSATDLSPDRAGLVRL